MLTKEEKKIVKKLIKYFTEIREKELNKNPLLTTLSISVELVKVTEFYLVINVADLVVCEYEDVNYSTDKSAVSFDIRICRVTGKTLNCPPYTMYYLENYEEFLEEKNADLSHTKTPVFT